jgi:phosphatidylserine decarboxylase
MATDLTIPYIDRSSGQLCRERVYADRFLNWSYNTRLGWAVTRVVFSHPLLSRLYGWTQRQSLSRKRIVPFVRQMGVDCAELVQPLKTFGNFSEFFERRINLSQRPIATDPGTCIAPVDGKVLGYQTVNLQTTLRVKRHQFSLESFLKDRALGCQYDGGSVVICRLCLADYHHIHFPDSGLPHRPEIINGSLYAGGPYALRRRVPFYAENLRMITPFDSDHFGRIIMVEVGAFTVGSIQQRFDAGEPVQKGNHKGFFELGGSTVVLLFKPNTIRLDNDLCANTSRGLETRVLMGESIGKAN